MNCLWKKVLLIILVIIVLPLMVKAEEEGFFGDLIVIQKKEDGSYQQVLKGQARIVYNNMTITSEEILFEEKTEEIVIEQDFTLTGEEINKVTGGSLKGNIGDRYFHIKDGVEVETDDLNVKAEEVIIENEIFTFTGKVSGKRQGSSFSCDKLTYNINTDEMKFEGNARVLLEEMTDVHSSEGEEDDN